VYLGDVDSSVRIAKRLIDIVGSSFGLAITLPLFPVVAAAVYIDSPGPVFFRQRRAGELLPDESGSDARSPRPKFREFFMLKFRSMRTDADKMSNAIVTQAGDPRVTRVGRFIRKTRLDELPQFINVLRGDMSLVGPRPERPELAEQLAMTIPYFEERMRGIKPGITGLAQISLGYSGKALPGSPLEPFEKDMTNPFKVEGADDALADHMRMKLLYDLAYTASAEHLRTFIPMELSIMLKTPIVMLRASGT
jgi:lipopolysaccharide/colanic/teichoic acid biosynthesis glycosyltransferase